MGKNNRRLIFKIRYRNGTGCFKTKFVVGNPNNVKIGGRILHVRKVSLEELFQVGEYNPLPKKLMREFGKEVIAENNTYKN